MLPLLLLSLLTQDAPPAALPPAGYTAPAATLERLAGFADRGAQVRDLGTSPGGHPVRVVSFGDTGASGRPEILVVANCEGDRLVATEVALALCAHLADGSPLLDAAAVHVVALANPDAAAAVFAGGEPVRGEPVDDDRDGFVDEDGPDDLDGDGRALWMRVPDVSGDHFADPADPRSSREADAAKGEAGAFRVLREGGDDDGDRVDQEDGIGGVHWDANWPHRFRMHQPESGLFQLSEPETRALADFVIGRRALTLVIVLDDEDNVTKAPGGASRTDKDSIEPLKDDVALLKLLAGRLESEDLPAPRGAGHGHGTFADWVYFQRGVPVLESAVWSMPLDAKAPESGTSEGDGEEQAEADKPLPRDTDELKLLLWNDLNYGGAGFAAWSEATHPRHGAVEVGGWLPLVQHNPPARDLPALGAHWADFLDSLAGDFAALSWTAVEATHLGGGVYDLRATLANTGLMPTAAAIGSSTRRAMPIRVFLELQDGGELLSGSTVQSVERLEGLGDSASFRWMLRVPEGSDAPQLRALSRTAGEAVHSMVVER
jgi:hypothetical protein